MVDKPGLIKDYYLINFKIINIKKYRSKNYIKKC